MFEASRASLAQGATQIQLGGSRKGGGGLRVVEQSPSCLAGSEQVEVRAQGPGR